MCSKNCCAVTLLAVAAFYFLAQYWKGLVKAEDGSDNTFQRPNWFIAIQIKNSEIHEALRAVQDHVVAQEPDLKSACVDVVKTHVTLFFFNADKKKRLKAVERIMEEGVEKFKSQDSGDPVTWRLHGLGNFYDKVVFANPVLTNASSDEIRFKKLWQNLAEPLFESGIIESNEYDLFRRHATVLKLHPKDGSNITSIPPDLYSDFNETDFGPVSVLDTVQLLSMTKHSDDGYYFIQKEIELFNP